MAKVLEFPVKKELPKQVEDRLHEIAEMYVTLLDNTLTEVCGDITDAKEYEEMTNLMLGALLEGVIETIDKMNES
jgi:ppGpp synthetase/RelA/SpoT-type nucleotidyltranferase